MRTIARVAVAALASTVLWSAGAEAGTHTTATVYRAFSYHGVIVPHVLVSSGYCWTQSNVTQRADAWRCIIGNAISDPCFSSALAYGVVVCPTPWNDRGVEIRLTKPLPKALTHSEPSSALQPWALQLASGAHCLLASGASNVVQGKRLNYFCHASAKYGLWGVPDRSTQPWTILIGPFAAKTLTKRAAIAHAWI
jgi:hypothetical protein